MVGWAYPLVSLAGGALLCLLMFGARHAARRQHSAAPRLLAYALEIREAAHQWGETVGISIARAQLLFAGRIVCHTQADTSTPVARRGRKARSLPPIGDRPVAEAASVQTQKPHPVWPGASDPPPNAPLPGCVAF